MLNWFRRKFIGSGSPVSVPTHSTAEQRKQIEAPAFIDSNFPSPAPTVFCDVVLSQEQFEQIIGHHIMNSRWAFGVPNAIGHRIDLFTHYQAENGKMRRITIRISNTPESKENI